MANVIISGENHADKAILSGGSWQVSLDNMKQRVIKRVARTTDAQLASTQFDVDLGRKRNISMIVLYNINLSIDAKIRITAYSDAFTTEAITSGWNDVWPAIWALGAREWEDDNYWDGRLSAETLENYTKNYVFFYDNKQFFQYFRIEVDDQGNEDGYLDIGRLHMSDGWEPQMNASYGASLGWVDDSTMRRSIGGVNWPDTREQRRTMDLTFDHLSKEEAYSQLYELFRAAGVTKQVFVSFDRDDAQNLLRHSFLGTLQAVDGFTFSQFNQYAGAMSLVEEL